MREAARLAFADLQPEDILATLATQNMVVQAGAVEVPDKRLRIEVTGQFDTPEDIGELVIRRSILDAMFNVGVELGQLLFIAVILAIVLLLNRLRREWPAWLRQVPAYGIGGIAAFWLIERVAGF